MDEAPEGHAPSFAGSTNASLGGRQNVSILSNGRPLKGLRGTVERVKDETRIVVNVPLLHQTASAEVDAGALRLA